MKALLSITVLATMLTTPVVNAGLISRLAGKATTVAGKVAKATDDELLIDFESALNRSRIGARDKAQTKLKELKENKGFDDGAEAVRRTFAEGQLDNGSEILFHVQSRTLGSTNTKDIQSMLVIELRSSLRTDSTRTIEQIKKQINFDKKSGGLESRVLVHDNYAAKPGSYYSDTISMPIDHKNPIATSEAILRLSKAIDNGLIGGNTVFSRTTINATNK